eukprot:5190766-Pyramimonas_sp.AAC.3
MGALFRAHFPGLVRTVGFVEPALLHVLRKPPPGALAFVHLALDVLAESGTSPPADLVSAVRALHETEGDVALMVPVLPALAKQEALKLLPAVLALPAPQVA